MQYAIRDTQYSPTVFCQWHLYICREPSTNQLLFMQNKPNFLDALMNVTSFYALDYENKYNWTLGENKPNQSQFYFFLVAKQANPALYSENTDT